jgi:flagellar hook-associated protein 3 FlgL
MTDRITPSMVTGTVLHDLNASFAGLNRASEELSSGKSIQKPSEDPAGAGRTIELESQLEGIAGYASGVQEGIARQNTVTAALGSITNIVQRVRALVVQSGDGVVNQTDLNGMAQEVEGLTETTKQYANVRFGHEYLLAGTSTESAPYSSGSEDAYHGNEGSVLRSLAPGATVQIGGAAGALLGEGQGSGDGKLLDVLRTIAAQMREGTPEALEALRGASLEGLSANERALAGMQAHAGTVVDQLQAAQSSLEEMHTTTTEMLSSVDGVNVAQTSIEYTGQQAAYEAALRSSASIVQMSLLEFLK